MARPAALVGLVDDGCCSIKAASSMPPPAQGIVHRHGPRRARAAWVKATGRSWIPVTAKPGRAYLSPSRRP